jgi:aerobic carbon-monoxide dehydrogenase large subunit
MMTSRRLDLPLVGQRVLRVNDGPLVRGTGAFLDDIVVPGLLYARVVRSQVAHGTVRSFDASTLPTGAVVFGPDDIASMAVGGLSILWMLGDQTMRNTPVVDRHIRFVGQPLGLVVAAGPALAAAAVEAVYVDVDPLPVVTTSDAALASDTPLLYPHHGSNTLARFEVGDSEADTDAVFAQAPRTLRTRMHIGRLAGSPLETRGIIAIPRPDGGLTVYTSTQACHAVRDGIVGATGLPQHRVRVITPNVGGGFGLKDHIYEDELMIVLAALKLRRPVKWVEDRTESLTVTTQARDEIHDVEVAFTDDGDLLALRVHSVRNVGAQLSLFGGGPLFACLGMLPGPYRWKVVRGVGRLVCTNQTPTGAYRGFGQTQAALLRERAVDLVATELSLDRVEIRLRNMIGPSDLPYATRTGLTYDNGDYAESVVRARVLIEAAVAERPAPTDSRRRGIGYCVYVQMAGVGPSNVNEMIGVLVGGYETCTVRMERDGTVTVVVGISPHGQGQETTFAQLVADRLGVTIDNVNLVFGDTEVAHYSAYGTAASRSIAVGGGATVLAADEVANKVRRIAADLLEADPLDVVLAEDRATVAGTAVGLPMADIAAKAFQGFGLPAGMTAGLSATHTYDPASATFSYSTHACQVAVDTETGAVEVENYVVVLDCGTVVNPTIVEGQIHGGVAQGLGAALLEEVVVDTNGQPRTSTLLDYLVPDALSVPNITVELMEMPSPYTPGGMKGMGEGGTNGAFGCVVNAVAAALPEIASRIDRTPLSPARLWALLHEVPS